MIKFKVLIRLPGLNEIIAAAQRNRYEYGQLKKRTEDVIRLNIREQVKEKTTTGVYIEFTWLEPNRRRDPDNIIAARKFIVDALRAEGVIGQDGWKNILGYNDTWRVSKAPGVIVEIF